jgi:adenylate kinase
MVRVFLNVVDTFVSSFIKEKLVEEGHEVVASCSELEYIEDGIKDVEELVFMGDKQGVTDLVKSADVAILSLHEGGHRSMSSVVRAFNQAFEPGKKLLCISSVMTWAKTITEDGKLHEDNYKTRAGGGKFSNFRTAETQVLAMGEKEGLTSHIIAAGLLYGHDESDFQSLLKEAWLAPAEELKIVSRSGGTNMLPTIHINDLAAYACALIADDELVAKKPYSVAQDNSITSLKDIATAVSKTMGEGKVRATSTEEIEMLLLEDENLSKLGINLSFNSENTLIEQVPPQVFACHEGPVAHMDKLVNEYKAEMDLRPIRLMVIGPPGAGSEQLGKALAKKYYLETLDLAKQTQVATEIEVPFEVDEEGNETAVRTDPALQAYVEEVARMVTAGQSLTAPLKARVIWPRLASKSVTNQGYVSVNLPGKFDEAQAMFFNPTAEGLPMVPAGRPVPGTPDPVVNTVIAPTKVICLTCDDDEWLKEQAIENAKATHEEEQAATIEDPTERLEFDPKKTEDWFAKAIVEYRAGQKDVSKTPLFFFEDACSIECLTVAVGKDVDANVAAVSFAYVDGSEGAPYNFHPTKEEAIVAMQEAEEAEKAAEEKATREREEAAAAVKEAKRQKEEAEQARLDAIADHENEVLESRSLPLRSYLMTNVIPTLTEGMLEVVKGAPEDPVDFLAEYLFKRVIDKEAEAAQKKLEEEQPQVDEEEVPAS